MYKLQPLDIRMFQPFSISYSIGFDNIISENNSFVSIIKRIFFFKLLRMKFL
jgi:hypothetical protein